MKLPPIRLAPLLLALLGPVLEADAGLTPVRYANRDYYRLTEWARERGFSVTRAPGNREIVVTSPAGRGRLQLDASRLEWNEVGIWLSNPVVAADGQVLVAVQDVRGVLDALAHPPRLGSGKTIKTICLDPGHGGKQPGHLNGGRLEKAYTLALAEQVRALLKKAGFDVVMTRRDDSYVDFPERTETARRANADLFVSLHFNSTPDGSTDPRGIEVYAMTPEGAKSTNISNDMGSLRAWAGNDHDQENLLLAYQLQKSLLQRLPGAEDRGVRRARFMVLRLAEMPAVLIEAGFMSNAADARWIFSETGRRQTAQAITEGILAYKRQVERTVNASPGQRSTSSTSSSNNARPGSAKN